MKNTRMLNGYVVVYDPTHPRAMTSSNWLGYVYEHIQVASKYLSRPLRDDEMVHHLNGDRHDNRISNLLVLPESQHGKLHAWINQGAPYLGTVRENALNSGKPKFCRTCGILIQSKQNTAYCSCVCTGKDNRKTSWPSKTQLEEDLKNNTWVALGKKYGVTDNAVRKWAKKYGIIRQS